MAEGDTIHRHAARLERGLVGQPVTSLYARGAAYPRLVGQTITAVKARGKHLLIDVGEARVHVHLGMHGRLWLDEPSQLTTSVHARASLVIVTPMAAAVWWRAPTVEVLRAAFAHAHPTLATLGPDVLSDDFDAEVAVTRARQRPQTTALGVLLLDQGVACGIGNIYKSEALFLERLDPFTPLSNVDDATLSRIYARARALMGSNLGAWPRTTTVDLSRGGFAAVGAARMHVYRRVGHPCRVCGTSIRTGMQGEPARRTYYCPRCQGVRLHSDPAR